MGGKYPPTNYVIKVKTKYKGDIPVEVKVKRVTYKDKPAVLVYLRDLSEKYERERVERAINRVEKLFSKLYVFNLEELARKIRKIMEETLHLRNPYVYIKTDHGSVEKGERTQNVLSGANIEISYPKGYSKFYAKMWLHCLDNFITRISACRYWGSFYKAMLKVPEKLYFFNQKDTNALLESIASNLLENLNINGISIIIKFDEKSIEIHRGITEKIDLFEKVSKNSQRDEVITLKKNRYYVTLIPIRFLGRTYGGVGMWSKNILGSLTTRTLLLISSYISFVLFTQKTVDELFKRLRNKEAQEEKIAQSFSGLAHDIKSEMAGIYGLLYLLKNQQDIKGTFEKLEEKIKNLADKLDVFLLIPRTKKLREKEEINTSEIFKKAKEKICPAQKIQIKINKMKMLHSKRLMDTIAREIVKINSKILNCDHMNIKLDEKENTYKFRVEMRNPKKNLKMSDIAPLKTLMCAIGGEMNVNEKKNSMEINLWMPKNIE